MHVLIGLKSLTEKAYIYPARLKINFRSRLNRVNEQFHGFSCLVLEADTFSNTGKIYMTNTLISITQTGLERGLQLFGLLQRATKIFLWACEPKQGV